MESIRWVLGESSAREMRGDSMDAVIFNGSAHRKPISRASVELVFDNSLGGATGEWSQYAEISVKRVIERDKGSSYYINNTSVRRRDVADLFLGTGLGGRAYAIIGQNTISRIVEARPEEMRVFLEEAAGISKYKERRRETELRLRDTRENLTRVEDVRLELAKQITRLESQAAITEQYHQLNASLKQAQAMLWLLKKQDAAGVWEKAKRQVERLMNDLEAQMASLRKSESAVESLRQQHYAATEQVQTAQARYYEANAEVSNLEQQVKHTQEARDRLLLQIEQIISQTQKAQTQSAQLQENLAQLILQEQEAAVSEAATIHALDDARKALPLAEGAFNEKLREFSATQKALADAEQGIRLESANADHLGRTIAELVQRQQRLETEFAGLTMPDEAELIRKQEVYDKIKADLEALDQGLAQLREYEKTLLEEIASLRESQLQDERALAQVEAQISSLQKIQQSLGKEAALDGWLKARGLSDSDRLWQKIHISPGWETALESVLGSRLNAIIHESAIFDSRPPAALVVGFGDEAAAVDTNAILTSMLGVIKTSDTRVAAVLQDWLAGVYIVSESEGVATARAVLRPGEMLVTASGDIHTPHSVAFYAAQSALHGVLERQREIESLHASQPALMDALQIKKDGLAVAEAALQKLRNTYQEQQERLRNGSQTQHQLNLEIQRANQQITHIRERSAALQSDLQALTERLASQKQIQAAKQAEIHALRESLQPLQLKREAAGSARRSAEDALNVARNVLQQVERKAQESGFNKKLISNNINELNSRIHILDEELKSLSKRKTESEAMLEAARMETLKANLEAALTTKLQCEQALAAVRSQMAETEQQLQDQERSRMQNEQILHPLRDKLEQARLAEQQTRLGFEQCQQALQEAGFEEASLLQMLPANIRVGDMEQQAARLTATIEALGPVNLAAIQELASERERKVYLDSQAADLEQAMQTLEDAIRKIDRETRSRLQQTFDEANRHFGELFMTLFGGGQARLELLGEEILDTGIQVFAQPPGKKNSTIHLLSGGEKALTALALVFALFRLNPAPFCLMDEVDAPLDDSNTERFCNMVKKMSERTQFLFVSHNKITMEMAQQLIGVTMQESGVSRVVEVDIEAAIEMHQEALSL
jgi:chromosome segregation protein